MKPTSYLRCFGPGCADNSRCLGREADADALAMHLLARSQGVAMLANAFHDEKFIKQEVKQMCDWLRFVHGEHGARAAHDERRIGDIKSRKR